VTALGAPYSIGPVDVALKGDTLEVRALRVAQPAGGTVEVTGRVEVKQQDLDLFVVLTDVPLESLPGVAGAGVPLSGRVSARLKLRVGRTDRRSRARSISRTSSRAASCSPRAPDVRPGARRSARRLRRVGPGELFSRFHLEAEAALVKGGPLAHALVSFRRVALDPLLPELAAFGDGRGMTSGRVVLDLEPGKPLALDVLLSELWLSIARSTTGEGGETIVQRVRVETTSPLHVTVEGDHLVLDKVTLATDGGALAAEGRLDGQSMSGAMSGHLDLELLQPFLHGALQSVSGDLKVEVKVAGTLAKPDLRGQIAIVDAVKVRPKDFPSDVTIGSGIFALDAGGVSVENVAVTVEGATLHFSGGASLGPGFAPENLSADLSAT